MRSWVSLGPGSGAREMGGRPSWMIRSINRRRPSGVNGAFWWGNRYSALPRRCSWSSVRSARPLALASTIATVLPSASTIT